ncbi:La-related protein 4 [Armadillidium vulgare]|nr:La-related protein 4 [Armadillidium vulgare]
MNGDIGKEVCAENSHTAESLPKNHSEDMSIPAKNDFESISPMEKMTEAEANSEMVHKEVSGDVIENTEIINGVSKDVEYQAAQHPQKEDKKDDTGQGKENESGSQPLGSAALGNKASDEPLTKEQIKELLGQSIEYFFSRENWSSDPYLLSQMDSDQYVPVYILANCSQFKSITKNHSIIMEALKDSLFVQLDEEKNRVRPNYKRCIVILREIPKTTPIKEIEAMFEGEGCPKAISCEFVHNDFWYVTFESDSDAQKAYRYLRETVKTFQNKPILARIKTKPMSRIGCLSVLPSYSGKPPSEAREGALASQGSGSTGTGVATGSSTAGPGIQGIPSPHPPPSAYAANNSQRINKNRDQNRDPKFEKNESRPINNGSGGNSQTRQNTVNSRPNSSQSPHPSSQSGTSNSSLNHSITSNQTNVTTTTTTTQPSHFSKGETQSNINTSINTNRTVVNNNNNNNSNNNNNNNSLGVVQTSHNSFAQNDLSLASQSNLYTSFSPPAVTRSNMVSIEKTSVVEPITATVTSTVTTVSQIDSVSSSSNSSRDVTVSLTSSLNTATSVSPTSVCTTVSQNFTTHTNTVVTSSANHTQVPQNSVVNPPVPHHNHHHYHNHNNQSMPSHRNSFNNEMHSGRDPQLQRQMTRGGRRRVSRRDEEMNGHMGGGGGRGSQRGSGNQNVNAADEVVVCSTEEKCHEPSQSAWSGETHTFSDVMKGTAKPKHTTSNTSQVEKASFESVKPSLSNSDTNEKVNEGTTSSTNLSSSESAHVNIPPSIINSSNNNINVNNSSNSGTKSITDSQPCGNLNMGRQERIVPPREDRRSGAGMHVNRREREFIPGIGRGGGRRDRDTGNFRLGNKENRPQTGSGNRSWREDRADADGWITKAPRDNRAHRDHRYQNQMHSGNHQHNFYENRNKNQMIVNGETSPPPPPPPPSVRSETVIKPTAEIKVNKDDDQNKCTSTNTESKSKSDITEKEKQSNTTDGEHKTSWAKMALASKDQMERLSAELKEKEEQERLKKKTTKVPQKAPERSNLGRDRDGKTFRRENFSPREREREFGEKNNRNVTSDFRGGSALTSDRSTVITGGGGSGTGGSGSGAGFSKMREALRPKSPK